MYATAVGAWTGRWGRVGLVGLGVIAATTRIDFALLPVVAWLARQLHAAPIRRVPGALLVAIDAVAGFVVTVGHTFVVSGSPLPTSVTTKLTWSAARPIAFSQLLQVFDLALLALVLVAAISALRQGREFWLTSGSTTLGSVLAMVGYAAFSATATAGAGLWYVVSLVVPIAVILASVGKQAADHWGTRAAVTVAAATSLGCLTPRVVGLQTNDLTLAREPAACGPVASIPRSSTS